MSCHDYEEGAVYACQKCGIEIKIVQSCQDCCGEHAEGECDCEFSCCGAPLTKK